MTTEIKNKLKTVPKTAGCYLWKDKFGQIIYVGKAKNLFNRTHQYFLKPNNNKTAKLVEDIADIDFVSVVNENEALILESNLIKKHKPKYNILLKDNNGYPYILVTNETKPQLLYTRNYDKAKGKYYGPFANSDMKAYDVYNLLLKLFPLRRCISTKNKKCFYYDLNMCMGACVGEDTKQKYNEVKQKIDNFFTKGSDEVLNELKIKEKAAVHRLDFEQAKTYLELQKSVELIRQKQIINLASKDNVDVVGFNTLEDYICIVIFSYVQGKLLNKHSVINSYVGNVVDEVQTYLFQYYSNHPKPKTLYVSLDGTATKLLETNLSIKIENPQKGKMHEIMSLATTNANNELKNKISSLIIRESRTIQANDELAKLLRMKKIKRIELFDNSNIFNADPVAAMVVFENGKENKKEYRKYKIKLSESTSDYEYMYEIIYRRYQRLIREHKSLPDLIIVDGGAQQVNAASKALAELNLTNKIKLIGLAKDDKHKADYIQTESNQKIELDKKSNLYFYLVNMQEEVHRFAIAFFRKTNRKSNLSSCLDGIKNLGKSRKIKLFNAFDTITKIKAASVEELSQIVPKSVAISIKAKFDEETSND